MSLGDLLREEALTKADISLAVDAYMADPGLTRLIVGGRFLIDPAAAVQDCDHAVWVLADTELEDRRKRAAVRTAILMARPERA
jgi:hypothetical protein